MDGVKFFHRLKTVPTKPGVYLMRDAVGAVLYVGKASSLRSRLGSYFSNQLSLAPKIRNLISKVDEFDFILTESDQEAVILECTLIKEHRPHYNARLKDDKSYPFIKIDVSEDFPLVYITRRVARDGARYFGPFASAGSVRRTLKLLKKLFPYRSCTKVITGTDPRPCLDYFIHRCAGPCIGAIKKEEYGEIIDQVIMFLEGRTDRVTKSIRGKMELAAETLEFERAAVLRDQLRAIEQVNERQKVVDLTTGDLDVIAAALGVREAWVEVFFVRQGKLIGRDNFIMEGTQDDEPQKVMTAFVKQFYDSTPYVPPKILVQHDLDDNKSLQEWLGVKRNGSVRIIYPQRGKNKKLVQMVAENAMHGLQQLVLTQTSDSAKLDSAMSEIQEALSLPKRPRRIECYDISNTQGTNSVGSMVVFENGKSKTSHYRRFKIKSVQGVDDYSMMREVLARRFQRFAKTRENSTLSLRIDKTKPGMGEKTWGIIPDLVLIDGGKGHLGAALQVFLESGIDDIPLASLAKENEEIYVPYIQEPVILPRNSQGLFLLQRVRDEAHRFAITYHKQRRSKKNIASKMDLVPGIGPKRRRMLLRQFGSIKRINEASLKDIASTPGMTLTIARKLKEYL